MGLAARDLTAKQADLARVVATRSVRTVKEAGKIAGYSHPSEASEALRKPAVQREIARIRAEKSDTAQSLLPRSLRRVASRLDEEEDVLRLTQVAVGMSKIIADGSEGDQVEHVTQSDRDAYRSKLIHAVRVGFTLALKGITPSCCSDLVPAGYPGKADSEIVEPSASC